MSTETEVETECKTIKKSEIAYLKGSGRTMKEISELYKITTAEVKEAFSRFGIVSKAKSKAYYVDYVDDSEEIMNRFSSNIIVEENLNLPEQNDVEGLSITEVAEQVMSSSTND